MAYGYVELASYFPFVAKTIACIRYTCPQRDDRAGLALIAWITTEIVNHPSTNLAAYSVDYGVTLLLPE